MLRSLDSQTTLRRRICVGALVVAVVAAAVGGWLAIANPRHETAAASPPPAEADRPGQSPAEAAAPKPAVLDQVATTADPQVFAESVAQALFEWDTTGPFVLNDYTGRLLAVADPTGEESPGLVADLADYLPTADSWAYLKPYYTRQWLEIASAEVPDQWDEALAEAGPQGLAPGTAAYTITGTRHRAGVWEGDDVASEHGVAFTVFVVCQPSYPTCRLLRLSRLDEPLE